LNPELIEERWHSYEDLLNQYFQLLEKNIPYLLPDEDTGEGMLLEDLIGINEELEKILEEKGYTRPYNAHAEAGYSGDKESYRNFENVVEEYFEKIYSEEDSKLRWGSFHYADFVYEYDFEWKVMDPRGMQVREFRGLYVMTIDRLTEDEFGRFIGKIKSNEPDGIFLSEPAACMP
jgi:hypothetical protein